MTEKQKIYFKTSRGFTSLNGFELPFQIGYSNKLNIEFVKHSTSNEYVVGIAIVSKKINEKNHKAFEDLSNNIAPEGVVIPEKYKFIYSEIDLDISRDIGKHILPTAFFPQSFQDCLNSVYGELHEAIVNTKNLIQWRTGEWGKQEKQNVGNYEFSLDKEEWWGAPMDIRAKVSIIQRGIVVPTKEIVNIIKAKTKEPLQLNILKEAYYLYNNSNDRSAFIMAITALEIGVKHYLATLFPDVEWLIFNLPSPPIERLLNDFINQKVDDSQRIKLSKQEKDDIKKFIQMRNSIVHGKKTTLTSRHVGRAIKLVQDITKRMESIFSQ